MDSVESLNYLAKEEIHIETRFIPFVRPNNYVKVDKTTLNGVYRISKAILDGSNTGTGASCEFVISVPKPKKSKKRKKNKKAENV